MSYVDSWHVNVQRSYHSGGISYHVYSADDLCECQESAEYDVRRWPQYGQFGAFRQIRFIVGNNGDAGDSGHVISHGYHQFSDAADAGMAGVDS